MVDCAGGGARVLEAEARDHGDRDHCGPSPAAGQTSNHAAVGARHADIALLTIEGESFGEAYLLRLQQGMAQPGELAALVAFLSGEMLSGCCRVIERALKGVSQ